MVLETVEWWARLTGGLAILGTLLAIFLGIWRGLRQPRREAGSPGGSLLQRPAFYLVAGAAYFSFCYLLWRPIQLAPSPEVHLLSLILGAALFIPGLALILWGRFTLGKWYYVSTSFATPLYDDHQLVINGPYALVRHPIYLGILMTGLGGILIYRTWTMVFVALTFIGLVVRARREEQVLAARFGPQWQAYCRDVPAWIPRMQLGRIKQAVRSMPPGLSALVEVGILFLPAIPAYIWLWPNVKDAGEWLAQILTYLYVLVGTLWIGLRRWNLYQLGINKKGFVLSLTCAAVVLTGRGLIIWAIDWGLTPQTFTLLSILGQILFYLCLVGLVEELLFRGLVYHALQTWRGLNWAIWGSSIGFVLWHIFGQGPLAGLGALLSGLIFALIRWRSGGILGLILFHALYDLETVFLVSGSSADILSTDRLEIAKPALIIIGYGLILAVPLYLWRLYGTFVAGKYSDE